MTSRQSHARAGISRMALAAGLALGLAGASQAAQPNDNEITKSQDTAAVRQSPVPDAANVSVSDAMMTGADQDKQNWLLHGRDYSNQRYSPLNQIDTSNVGQLAPAAIVQTGMVASFETTPVVVDGVMYVSTPMVDNKMQVMALDAATGERYWTTTYDVATSKLCCGPVNRGVAVGYGTVYLATVDANLLALDAKTGEKKWETQIADPQAGFSETMAPQIYDGMVIVGSSGGEWPIRGFVAAYDAKTGKQDWRWNATDPNSFEGDSWKSGGGMVWTTPAIDPKRGLIIFATGNPNPDLDGTHRKGDNLYTDSIVALDVKTGDIKWYYQEVKHDVWDYDAVSNVVLLDAKDADGKTVPVAAEAGKVGWLFIVDRDTGKLIRKSDPLVKMSDNMFTTPTKAGVQMLPGANGGAEWSPPAYSPDTHDLYVMEMDQLMTFTTDEATRDHPRSDPAWQHLPEREGRQGGARRRARRGQRRHRQGGLEIRRAAADDRRRAGHRRQPRFHRRGQRRLRRLRRQDRQEAVELQPRRRRERAAHHLRGQRAAVHCGRGGRQLPARFSARRRDRHLQAEPAVVTAMARGPRPARSPGATGYP